MSRATLLNAGLFQITWFACVLGGPANGFLWGAAAVAGMLWFSARTDVLAVDVGLAAVAAAVGFVLDSLWIHLGILDYRGAALAPMWIVLLWVGVGLSMNHSLALFQARPLLGGVLAGACAPLSYLGGERLGGVVVPDPWMLIAVSATWFVLFALAFHGVGLLNRRAQPSAPFRQLHEEVNS